MSSPPGDYYSPILVNFLTVTEQYSNLFMAMTIECKGEISFKDSILFKGRTR